MSLKTTVWRITDHLEDPEAIFYYLEAELEEGDAVYAARALRNVMQIRGGCAGLSAETGIAAEVLEQAAQDETKIDRETLTRVMEVFRPVGEVKVA